MQSNDYLSKLEKQHYAIVGSHSAVKPCTWMKKSLRDKGVCYKEKFYGIKSHRCLQMTPNVYCNQRCNFCWRTYDETGKEKPEKWDEPEKIIEGAIEAQRHLINGFPGSSNLNKQKFKEANDPNQVALSLTGEPMGYPFMGDLVEQFHKKDFTTFIVTNGLYPKRMAEMNQPTQLYVSLDAPDEETHKIVNRPMVKNSWNTINETLELLPSLDGRKALRVTVVKGFNDKKPREYARLIEKSEADFLEIKGYMFVGGSRERMSLENMPYHDYVKEFAEQINKELGYDYVDEQPSSRVVLYSSGRKKLEIKR